MEDLGLRCTPEGVRGGPTVGEGEQERGRKGGIKVGEEGKEMTKPGPVVFL